MFVNEPEIAFAAINKVVKVWGTEFWIVNSDLYCLKFLKINPGFECSVHKHLKKDETFLGLAGTLEIHIHDDSGIRYRGLMPGETFHIPPGVYHSFSAFNVTWIMEVSTHHDDADVVRLRESRRIEPC